MHQYIRLDFNLDILKRFSSNYIVNHGPYFKNIQQVYSKFYSRFQNNGVLKIEQKMLIENLISICDKIRLGKPDTIKLPIILKFTRILTANIGNRFDEIYFE